MNVLDIQRYLDDADQPASLRDLFCRMFNWGVLTDSHMLEGRGPNKEDLTAQGIAQLGGVPIFRIDWPTTKLPTITQRRAVQKTLSEVANEHILCYVTSESNDGPRLAIVWARDRGGKRLELRTLPYERGTPARTTLERLAILGFTLDDLGMFGNVSATIVLDRINQAFDVEAVTKQFFTRYREAFAHTEAHIRGISGDHRRMVTQKLLNRLMFIVFLERKGWLTFQGRTDYLKALWDDHIQERLTDPTATFYTNRLTFLFFAGLNTPHEVNVIDINRQSVLASRIGQVPYLNGGLFEEQQDDKNSAITIPDDALEDIITNLFYTFNFTVSESTPFDIEVAVDPEMLGKIFEELITGRHESGSYYTPRGVVAFMCREALKGYLAAQLPDESPDTIANFVDERGAADLRDPEAVLAALKTVRICDPACGSGAYLLGMLHELLSLRAGLFAARKIDATTIYQRKLEIIQGNLYGVDKDPFAVNIARLRLWLSLVVDYEGNDPPPLPNLDYKLEEGDSLTAPDPSGGLEPGLGRHLTINDYFTLKDAYLRAHGNDKLALREQITDLQQQIATLTPHGSKQVDGFDWLVEFAEVFAATGTGTGGFDIVVANPPYVRQELIKDLKPALKPIYTEVYTGTSDLYVYFYARALQILRPAGMLAFISSNKWFRAGYGKKLRSYLATQTRIHSITDFGDLPVFGATAYPVIVIGQKQPPTPDNSVWYTAVQTLDPPYPDVRELVSVQGQDLPPEAIQGENWHLGSAATVRLMEKIRKAGPSLKEYVNGRFYRGIVTGYNEAFIIDRFTRDRLIAEHPSSAKVLKSYLRGRDIKRWQTDLADLWIIFTRHGTDINKYPAILAYLKQFKQRLTPGIQGGRKPGSYAWYEIQDNIAYWQEFEHRQIVWGNLATRPQFAFATPGTFLNAPACTIISDSTYLLAILNSSISRYLVAQSAAERQGGFLEFKPMYVSQIPIPAAPPAEREAIAHLARHCIDARGQGAQVAAWEAEIDERVARLYGLTAEEMREVQA